MPAEGFGSILKSRLPLNRIIKMGILLRITTVISSKPAPTEPPLIVEWIICHKSSIESMIQNLGYL